MNKIFQNAMDPISSETHFLGACFSMIGLIIFIVVGLLFDASYTLMIGGIVFGLSSIALYSASATYHFFQGSEHVKTILRKLDHSMIYVLIVGTYTPVILYCMEAPQSYYFLSVLWSIALLGIILKIIWVNTPRILTTAIYLILGWSIVFDFQAFQGIPYYSLILIALGGIMYSIGAFIYMLKKPNFSEAFGFHELFHIFVMLGSFFHYIAIILLMI